MVSKKDILNWLINKCNFEKRYNNFQCRSRPGACYYVDVISRAKNGWTYVFFNHNGEMLKFNRYFMTFLGDGSNEFVVALNENNKETINSILKTFTGVDVPEVKKNIPNFAVNIPYIGCADPFGENKPDKEIDKIIRTLSKYPIRKHDYDNILNTIASMCVISYENGMANKSFCNSK